MNIRTKTKRRLLIILGVVLLIGVAVLTAVLYRNNKLEREARDNRVKGLEAVQKGEFRVAHEKLRLYLIRYPKDVEVLYQFALARQKLELPGGQHLIQAADRLKRVLEFDPNNTPAQEELLKVYTQIGYGKEASDLADRILAQNPKHIEALRGKGIALLQVRQFDQAFKFVDRGLAVAPNDYGLHRLALELLLGLDRPQDEILARFEKELKAHPNDPRFLMLMGGARLKMRDVPKAVEWFKKAAAMPLAEAKDVQQLALAMEEAGMFSEATELLQVNAQKNNDLLLSRMLIQRLWQTNRDKEIMLKLANLDPESRDSNSDLLAYKAMSLIRMDKKDEAMAYVASLAKRTDDNRARAWSAFIKSVVMAEVTSSLGVVDVCRKALTAAPDNAAIRYFLGEAYAQLGENEPAIEQWKLAGRYANGWSMPFIRISQTYAATNRGVQALQFAEWARQRSPNNIMAATALAAAAAELPGVIKQDDLLRLVAEIQKTVEGEPRTLSIYADLLAIRGQKKEATEVIQKAISVPPEKALPEQLLIRLAQVSKRNSLGLHQQCLHASEKAHGLSATLALMHAIDMVTDDKSAAGIEYLQKAIESKNAQNDLEWTISWAKLLDATNDPRAKGVWILLAESEIKNLNVQRLAVEARAVQRERDFLDKTIERLKSLSFDEALTWRMARARWWLSSDKPDRDVPKAIVMLAEIVKSAPDLLEPRLYLAAAQERNDNFGAAAEQLAEAARIAPENLEIAVDLARIRLFIGDPENAREALKPALKMQNLPMGLRPKVASILAQTGESDRAVAMLTQTNEPSMMLAELYIRRNELKKAEEVFKALVNAPGEPNSAAIRSFAFFLAGAGRSDESLVMLGKLKDAKLDPGVLEAIRGDFNRRYIGADEAIGQYRQSLKISPENRNVWRTLVGYYFELNRINDAFAAAAEAKAALGDEPAINLLIRESELFRKAAAADHLRPLVQTILIDRENRDSAVEVVRLMLDAEIKKEPAGSTLIKLRQLADRNARFMGLQNIVIDLAYAIRQYDTAADVSTRAMRTFSQNSEPAERLAKVFVAQGKLKEAIGVAEVWRQRSVSYPMAADVFIADLKLLTRDPVAALTRIEPYRNAAITQPDRFPNIISIYTRGLVMTDQTEKATAILKPLLPLNSGWRSMWVQIATRVVKDHTTIPVWLERVEAVTPPTASIEWANIGVAWYETGRRLKKHEMRVRGREMIQRTSLLAGADPAIVVLAADLAMADGDIAAATASYRQVLRSKSSDPIAAKAMNNLAVIMNDRGEDSNEAEGLVRKAIDLQPTTASFHDTLGQVLLKRRQIEDAIVSLRKAVELEPGVVEWKLNLAEAQATGGKRVDAERSLQAVEALSSDPESAPKAVRDRIAKIRALLPQKSGTGVEKQAVVPGAP